MSIFQLQDYWSVNLCQDGDDEFDAGCVAIGNLDNAANGSDKIAVGSLNGVLRIFNPSKNEYKGTISIFIITCHGN